MQKNQHLAVTNKTRNYEAKLVLYGEEYLCRSIMILKHAAIRNLRTHIINLLTHIINLLTHIINLRTHIQRLRTTNAQKNTRLWLTLHPSLFEHKHHYINKLGR